MADDDADDVSFFEETLFDIDRNIFFDSASNGYEALIKIKNAKPLPDIIFLDLNMPRYDGKQCLAELKKDKDLQQVPVIIFTTSSYKNDITQLLAMGATCFVTKPTDIHELKAILSAILAPTGATIPAALSQLSNITTPVYW
jgi:DNA-binding response OmpR family regulator